ncbi:MAG: bacterial proteasome activator family protein [Acidimicrobiaceae bacterium]|nr:bacterial proteasome activator family protein [Acidimicrobiaceae bacterium]
MPRSTNDSEKVLLIPEARMLQDGDAELQDRESVSSPSKVLRIGSMIKTLLDEVRGVELDEASRNRLAEIYHTSIDELKQGLSPDLGSELEKLSLPFSDDRPPSESELRVAQAQLVGWLEGLFHGIQATLFAQQNSARAQLEDMRRKGLPAADESAAHMPGTYL